MDCMLGQRPTAAAYDVDLATLSVLSSHFCYSYCMAAPLIPIPPWCTSGAVLLWHTHVSVPQHSALCGDSERLVVGSSKASLQVIAFVHAAAMGERPTW